MSKTTPNHLTVRSRYCGQRDNSVLLMLASGPPWGLLKVAVLLPIFILGMALTTWADDADSDADKRKAESSDRPERVVDRPNDRRPDRDPRPGGNRDQRGPFAMPMIRALDRDGDGKISPGELDLAVASLRTLDTNGDGVLVMGELLPQFGGGAGPMFGRPEGMRGPGPGGTERGGFGRPRPEGMPQGGMPPVDEIFSRFDANDDGAIDRDEAPERMVAMFDRIDQNGDSKIQKEEMNRARERMMREMRNRPGMRGRQPESSDPPGGTRPRRPDPE